jgi:hypothetical protein
MAPVNSTAFAQATERVRTLRKAGTSENSLAKTIGVSRTAIRTILNRGAHHTRGQTKKRVIKWVSAGGHGPTATPKAGRPPVAKTGAPTQAAAAAGRRSRHRSAQPATVTVRAATPTTNGGYAQVELEDGRIVRLVVGTQYILHHGRLLRAL